MPMVTVTVPITENHITLHSILAIYSLRSTSASFLKICKQLVNYWQMWTWSMSHWCICSTISTHGGVLVRVLIRTTKTAIKWFIQHHWVWRSEPCVV